jgi:FkbM family methyltransferase
MSRTYESEKSMPISIELLKKNLPEDPIIIEAGAKYGTDTIRMSKIWPKGEIYTFEPIPTLYGKTLNNTANYRNIKCFPFALNDKCGKITMYVSSGKSVGSSSLLKPAAHKEIHPDTYFNNEIEVEAITIDKWAKQENISKIDFLWLDTQGTELAIMKSSPKIFSTLNLIHLEVSLIKAYENAPLYNEVRLWLENQNFKVIAEELPWSDMGNVLFKRVSK